MCATQAFSIISILIKNHVEPLELPCNQKSKFKYEYSLMLNWPPVLTIRKVWFSKNFDSHNSVTPQPIFMKLAVHGQLKLAYGIFAGLVERRLRYDHEKFAVWFIPHGWSISQLKVPVLGLWTFVLEEFGYNVRDYISSLDWLLETFSRPLQISGWGSGIIPHPIYGEPQHQQEQIF